MEFIKLSNNVLMPKLGMGTNTFGKRDNDYNGPLTYDVSYHLMAIKNGYKMFDTAVSYRNEALVGQAIKASGIRSSEFFVISKIPVRDEYVSSKDAIINTIEKSLSEINLEYIDLYLIHHPVSDKKLLLKIWKIMEEYYYNGRFRAIGVSNFSVEDINYLIKHGSVAPMVNQIEVNPTKPNKELIEELKPLNVAVQAWSPLNKVSDEVKLELAKIGEKHKKSWAQVLIRYHIDKGISVVAKSHDDSRQKENMDVFDFKLTKKELREIELLF